MLSEEDNSLLMDAVFQIIDTSRNEDAMFTEMCSLSKRVKRDSDVKSRQSSTQVVSSFVSATTVSASDRSSKVLFTPSLARQIRMLAEKTSPQGLLDASYRNSLTTCCNLISASITQKVFIPSLFLTIISKGPEMPLDVLWNLHQCGALPIQDYLTSKLSKSSFSQSLAKTIVLLCAGSQDELDYRKKLLSGILGLCIKQSYQGKDGDKRKLFSQLLDYILEELETWSESDFISETLTLPFDLDINEHGLSEITWQKFVVHAVSVLLTNNTQHTAYQCLEMLSSWDKTKHGVLRLVFSQLLHVLNRGEIRGLFERAATQEKLSLAGIWNFLNVWLIQDSESASDLKDCIKDWSQKGLEHSQTSQLALGFLLARLSNELAPQIFPAYQDWFQMMFGEASSSVTSSKSSFTVLVKFLSDLVPTEKAEYLKAHILKRPFIPAKCKDMYEDYVLLAKTRLSDLKVPLTDQWSGIYEAKTAPCDTDQNKTDPAERDVEKAIEMFETNGKLPTVLVEASIFRKPYFVGKFLPALLKPRLLPDIADSRMKLIEAVKSSGKISELMHQNYVEGCQRERQNLLEGVFDVDDDDDLEELTLTPEAQFELRLDKLKTAILAGQDSKVSECVLTLSDIVSKMRMDAAESCSDKNPEIVINLHNHDSQGGPDKESPSSKVVSSLVAMMTDLLELTDPDYTLLTYLMQCVQALCQKCPLMVQSLTTAVLGLTKIEAVEVRHLPGLACLWFCVMVCQPQLHICVKCVCSKLQTFLNLEEAIVGCIPWHVGAYMEKGLSFLLMYANCLRVYREGRERADAKKDIIEVREDTNILKNLPGISVVKYIFLLQSRIQMSSEPDCLRQNSGLMTSQFGADLASSAKPSLQDWMTFELQVDKHTDILTPRDRSVYYWKQAAMYLKDLSLPEMCTEIFCAVVQFLSQQNGKQQNEHPNGSGSSQDFVTLLTKLLVQLPPLVHGSSPWLATCLTQDIATSHPHITTSLILDLPSHLMLKNTPDEKVSDTNIECLRSVLALFMRSAYNEGGYLSANVTVWLCQGLSSTIWTGNDGRQLFPVLAWPAVLVSTMVHYQLLTNLGICNTFPESWHKEHRVLETETSDELPGHFSPLSKAAALFAECINGSLTRMISQIHTANEKVVTLFLELCMCHVTLNGDDQELCSPTGQCVCQVLSQQPQYLTSLLTSNITDVMTTSLGVFNGESMFASLTGGQLSSPYFRTYCVLRLCNQVPLVRLVSSPVIISSLVSAYCGLLREYFDKDALKVCSESVLELSRWMRQVISSSTADTLQHVSVGNLREADPLLFSLIKERRKSGR